MAVIIESDDAVRDSLKALIVAHGWACEAFADGAAFLKSVPVANEDFVVIDSQLEGMSCAELLDALAAHSRSLPIIVITPRDDAKSHAALLRAGADAVLVRPFSGHDLAVAIAEALRESPKPRPLRLLKPDTPRKIERH